MFPERIETERLRLERISGDSVDVFALYEFYRGSPESDEMFAYWDSSPHRTVKETAEYIEEAEQLWADGEAAKYVIRPTEGEEGAGAIAGTTGLYPDWETNVARLGIILDPRYWGRGYAGERAEAILAVAFERLDLDLVIVGYVDGNDRSRRAIEKYVDRYGGQYDGLFRNWVALPDRVGDVHRYTISFDQYFDAIES